MDVRIPLKHWRRLVVEQLFKSLGMTSTTATITAVSLSSMIEHHRDVLRVTLRYKDIGWLFRLPDITPFSEDFEVYSANIGVVSKLRMQN
jgi:hypothetical protein